MSFSVQPREANSAAIQGRLGVAVSIAIASLVSVSPRTCTLVATGPTTRVRSSMGTVRALRFEGRADAVEGLADHSVRGALDEPRADRRKMAVDLHIGDPVHDRRGGQRAIREAHLRGGVDRGAGRLTVGVDDGAVRWFELGQLELDVEARADETHADLRGGIEMGGIDDVDRFDAGATAANL